MLSPVPENLYPPPTGNTDNDGVPFSLSSAKDFFENKATDLRFVDFSKQPSENNESGGNTRGYIPSDEQIIPIWDKASVYTDSTKIIHEIPLANIGVDGALLLDKTKDSITLSEELKVMSYLVVVKSLITQTTIVFVCTIFGTYNEHDNGNIVSYMKYNPGFTGYLILSDVSGLYLASYMYENGEGDWAVMKSLSKEDIPEEFAGFIFIEENANNPAFAKTRGGIESDSIFGGEFEEVVVVAKRKAQTELPSEPPPWPDAEWELLIGSGSPSSGDSGSGNPSVNTTVEDQFLFTLELRASGDGSVSPAGITNYALKNTTVYITATPNNSLTVFGGWFENSTLISNDSRHAITISSSRCITGTFFLSGDPCGELSTKYRTNARMNNNINNTLRAIMAPNNPGVEVGYLVTNTLGREDQPPGTQSSISIHFKPNTIYTELSHIHPGGTITPSAADLRAMYTACNDGRINSSGGFIFNIVTSTEVLSLEIADVVKFKNFAKNKLDTDENFDVFRENYRESVILIRSSDYHTNSADRAIKWLFDQDSGLKFAKAKTVNRENDWVVVNLDKGVVKIFNCNGK